MASDCVRACTVCTQTWELSPGICGCFVHCSCESCKGCIQDLPYHQAFGTVLFSLWVTLIVVSSVTSFQFIPPAFVNIPYLHFSEKIQSSPFYPLKLKINHRCSPFIFSSRHAIWRGQKAWFLFSFFFPLGDSLAMSPAAPVNVFLISLREQQWLVCKWQNLSPSWSFQSVSQLHSISLAINWRQAGVVREHRLCSRGFSRCPLRSNPGAHWKNLNEKQSRLLEYTELFLLPLEWQENRKLLHLSTTLFDIVESLEFFFF